MLIESCWVSYGPDELPSTYIREQTPPRPFARPIKGRSMHSEMVLSNKAALPISKAAMTESS